MAQADFSTLDNIFTNWTPADLVGTVTPNLGGVGAIPGTPAVANQSAFNVLRNLLQNTGRGIVPASQLKDQFQKIATSKGVQGADLSQFLTFYSTQGFVNELGPGVAASKTYMGPDGSKKQITGIQEIIGKDFPLPNNRTPMDVSLIMSNTPFFSPMTRGTHQVELFLNSMPSTILSQLSPFLQVEFQMPRSPSKQLQAPGLLKFLLGATDINDPARGATDIMAKARQVGTDKTDELDFAGMEMFTAPQTLTSLEPANRYADVVDPFRPFGSIDSLTISVVPAGAGFYTYKKATLIMKIHDRSRLGEISDFLRPRVYSGVTCWLTYGWRAPDRPGENPYFDYVNDNMMLREAYGITNCGFTFDHVGQVTLTIELFTKGVNEMRQSKISDNNNDLDNQFRKIEQISERISEYRQALHLDPQAGVNKELRPYIVLDAAEQGVFPPNLSGKNDIQPAITSLRQALLHTKGIDTDAVNGLIQELHNYYDNFTQQDPITGKMTLQDQVQTRVTQTIQAMFTECLTGPDPFLATGVKGDKAVGGLYAKDIAAVLDEFQKAPTTKTVLNLKRNYVVSFGKLFTVFAMRNLISADVVHELQVFFYPLNESCGPVSGMSVAQFPIDMSMFLDQYREYVIRNGGERITLEDFLGLVITAQFLDPRALGYGMRKAYAPFDPKDPDAKKPDKQGQQDSALDAWGKQYGTFKQPTIEMMIEVGHPTADAQSQCDVLASLNSSASSNLTNRARQSQQIMRIHIYDKQVNPYKTARKMLANIDGTSSATFSQEEPPAGADLTKVSSTAAELQAMERMLSPNGGPLRLLYDRVNGRLNLLNTTSNQRMKDAVSKMVPTIRFGANGTTIINASLGSHADPRVTSVNMQRAMVVRNQASPNGSGEFGLPLRVIPAQLTMVTLGNPLAQMAQVYFIDFQTGTTLDNLYIVTGLTHTITPGKFETSWQFGYSDAYGVFEQAVQIAKNAASNKTEGLTPTK